MSRATPRRAPNRRAVLTSAAGLAGLSACASSRARAHDEQAELSEIFSTLGDQSARWAPISAAEKRPRLARLAGLLRTAGVDALLIEPGPTLSYLSNLSWGRSERLFALVVLADGSSFWLAPAFEVPMVARRRTESGGPDGEIVAWQEHEYAWEPLAAALRARRVERIAIEPSARAFVHQRLATVLGAERVLAGGDLVRALRACKEPREIELLRGACELTQRAIRAVAERLRPGLSDHEIGRWLTFAQERLGLAHPWVLPLIGPSAAYPHGEPEGRLLERGVGLLVDTGGTLHGYQSDISRSWTFGAAPEPAFARAWTTVRAAQRAAFEAIAPGVACGAVDAAARRALEAAGYPGGYAVFGHRLGHGIGLEGHEDPYFDGASTVPLEPGMTLSDEPGIYLAGSLGVRLEDIVHVTEGGAEVFGTWQEAPSSP